MKIVIWTTSAPKVEAIKEAIEKCVYFLNEEIELVDIKVNSWVSDMPTSIEENMLGAKNRAYNCLKVIQDADFYVWMEWWVWFIWEKTYLFWVVYILNRKWIWHFWISNMMEVPKYFHKKILIEKMELWPILAEATWIENASKKNWAFGAWSDDMLNRKDQFLIAFLSAIPAFYNKYYKL